MSTMTSKPTKSESLLRIERELGVLIHRWRRRVVHNAAAVHTELQPAALPVLLFVVDNEGVRASDVVEHFGIDKGAISRHVVHLEALGLIARTCDPDDRRAQTLVPTDLARTRVAEVRADRRRDVARRLSDWSADDIAALADQLGRYNASLETRSDEPADED
ncbi:MAG TPA: helix-turn-helix domain-containing protein [Nocardioidaceae bacterium]|nr:helix-turn-helix domain-containing protein [Nocardioidaceae bacterium]